MISVRLVEDLIAVLECSWGSWKINHFDNLLMADGMLLNFLSLRFRGELNYSLSTLSEVAESRQSKDQPEPCSLTLLPIYLF